MIIERQNYRNIGDTGIQVSPIALGTMEFDTAAYLDSRDDEAVDIICTAMDLGINFFDTAECYGDGHAEDILGRAIRKAGRDVVVLSKIMLTRRTADEIIDAARIRRSVETSLRHLQRDYIDIYLIHWPTKAVSMKWVMEELSKLKDEGKIRSLGVSNFNLDELAMASQGGKIDVLESAYNLAWRCLEKDVLPYCEKNKISFIPYSPLAQGILSGAFTRTYQPSLGSRPQNYYYMYKEPYYSMCMDILDVINGLCRKHGCKPAQVALAWLLSKKVVCSVLLGIEKREQLIENIAALSINLDKEEILKLDAAGLPMLNSITPRMERSICGWWPDIGFEQAEEEK
jgi:myo-inositol catabolism protein IolS